MNVRKKGAFTLTKAPSNKPLTNDKITFIFQHFYYITRLTNIDHNQNLTSTEKSILSLVLTFWIQGKQFYQSNRAIANNLGKSKPTIIHNIHRLMKQEYIKCGYLSSSNKSNISRRYIILNLKKVLGESNKNPASNSNKSFKPTKSRTHKSHKINSNKSNKLNNSNKPNQKPLTTNQKQQIKKAIHIIGRNVVSYNPKHLKNHFISEYQNGKLNFSNLDDALIKYQYNKMNNISIPKPVGYICAVTHDNFNKNKVNQMEEAIKANKYQNKEDDNLDDDRYGDEDPIYNRIGNSPKLCRQYYKKYGVKFDTSNKKDLKKLIRIFHINFNQSHDSFMEYLQNLIDTGKIGSITHDKLILAYIKKHSNNKKGK